MVKEYQFWFAQFADVSITVQAPWAANYSVSVSPSRWGHTRWPGDCGSVVCSAGLVWPATGANPVHLGVHFANAGGGSGNNTWYTDQRFSLPRAVESGAGVKLSVSVTCPAISGDLVLQYQMVKEYQFWFAQFADVSITVQAPWASNYSVTATPTSCCTNHTHTYNVKIPSFPTRRSSDLGANPVHLGVHFANAGGGSGNNTWYTDQRFSLP